MRIGAGYARGPGFKSRFLRVLEAHSLKELEISVIASQLVEGGDLSGKLLLKRNG